MPSLPSSPTTACRGNPILSRRLGRFGDGLRETFHLASLPVHQHRKVPSAFWSGVAALTVLVFTSMPPLLDFAWASACPVAAVLVLALLCRNANHNFDGLRHLGINCGGLLVHLTAFALWALRVNNSNSLPTAFANAMPTGCAFCVCNSTLATSV